MESDRAVSILDIGILTPESGLKAFQELNHQAESLFAESKNALTAAFVALDLIREHALFSYGGYSDWKSYLNDFLDQNGVSRSLGYENLAIVRIAKAACFTSEELVGYGLYTIKPFFERKGPILDYDKDTGEIITLSKGVEELLPEGDTINERFGSWVKDSVDKGEPGRIVRQNLRDVVKSGSVFKFTPHYEKGIWVGLQCYVEHEDDTYEDRFIYFSQPPEMSDVLRIELFRRLKVHPDFIL